MYIYIYIGLLKLAISAVIGTVIIFMIGDFMKYCSCSFKSFVFTSKVRRNLTIPSREASEYLFLSSSDLKSYFEENLDLDQ